MIVILVLATYLLTACHASELPPATDSNEATVTPPAETDSENGGPAETDVPGETTGASVESAEPTPPREPTTDATYPDGENNPDRPYSPGVYEGRT